ncbi:TylF/MycF/NovP-related O-methyltransferase [Nonomuraea rubra]|uniref:Uncharacterized protein n=1 Tax=Nonomuraea rubra TaxID=46180 RepID=A0A7X0NYE4_9ACTN|nr:TylF/MycF/NovP-related O-methyltransferase [Nonomuraea rubra]MBB6551676.1 hypothetical protein [Nonomuraea rubra]
MLDDQPRTINRGRLEVVRTYLTDVAGRRVPGAVVELGCYRGAMTAWLRAVLDRPRTTASA